jgi:branched-chain amino acid transport system ATP-binding protein
MSEALSVRSIGVRFGGVQALSDVSFAVEAGELVGLIGPNGAGKTTMLKVIAGAVKPDRGRVWLGGRDVTRIATAARVRGGLATTHQIVRPFRSMTTLDNVAVAAGWRHTSSPLTALFHRSRKAEELRAADILAKVGLGGLERKPASSLPLGHLKRLELARALATEPDVIILDEPLAGLNQREAQLQADVLARLNADGVTTILIEHNLREVLRVCKRLIVLDGGRLIADGRPDEVMARADVREAYLGKAHGHVAA